MSLGHSAATVEEARAGYAAGGRSTTHLFNAMTGVDHRAPGLAVAALLDDARTSSSSPTASTSTRRLAAHPRLKPPTGCCSSATPCSLAGMGDGRGWIGGLEVEVAGDRVTLVGTTTLAGSVIALDDAVRNLVAAGVPLPAAVAAASAIRWRCSASPTAAGSRSASAPTSSSSTTRSPSVGSCARARGSGDPPLRSPRSTWAIPRSSMPRRACWRRATARSVSRARPRPALRGPGHQRRDRRARGQDGRLRIRRETRRRGRRLPARGASGAAVGAEHLGRGRRARGLPRRSGDRPRSVRARRRRLGRGGRDEPLRPRPGP